MADAEGHRLGSICFLHLVGLHLLAFFLMTLSDDESLLVISLGLILFFVIPRVPTFGFAYGTPLVENGGPTPYFNRYPANFSFTGGVDLQADTHSSYTPVHFKNITAEMYSADTFKLVATGSTGEL